MTQHDLSFYRARVNRMVLAFAMVMTMSFGYAVQAQEGPGHPEPPARNEVAERERAREAVRLRIERLKAEQARLEATLAAIDAGQPLSDLSLPQQTPGPRGGDPRQIRDRTADGADSVREREDEFTDEQIRAFIAEVYPEWAQQMTELDERDPQALQRMLAERRPRLVELMRERRDHPEAFEVRQEIARSEMRLRRAAWSLARAETPEERAAAEARVDQFLSEQFDLRVKLARTELEEVENRASMLRRELETTLSRRLEMLTERKDDLLRAIRERRPGGPPRDGGRPGPRDSRPDRPGRGGGSEV